MSQDIHEIAQGPVEAFRGSASGYYKDAEVYMERQWSGLIWPSIKDFNFENTLDFAAGHGRNSVLLSRLAKLLYAVEANPDAVKHLEARFASQDPNQCKIQIIHNNGLDLRNIPSNTITALYSFDSMVHFEKRLIEAYMPEFERAWLTEHTGSFIILISAGFRRTQISTIIPGGVPTSTKTGSRGAAFVTSSCQYAKRPSTGMSGKWFFRSATASRLSINRSPGWARNARNTRNTRNARKFQPPGRFRHTDAIPAEI